MKKGVKQLISVRKFKYLLLITAIIVGISGIYAVFVFTSQAAASSSFTAVTTVANVSATDNQTAATSTTVANVAEVKASRTLTVGALPATSETITVGTCVITFTTVASSTVDEVDCADYAASVDRDIGTGDIPRVATQTAEVLRTLTNVSDAAHGALTVGGSDDTVSFTTTGVETSATAVTFTDGTSGDITSTGSTVGVVAVAQVSTLTPANVEVGDIFVGIINSTSYTATATAATVKNVVELLQPLMDANGAVTCTEDDTAVTCTADTAGTAFTLTSSVTNTSAVAQEVTFTPANVVVNETFNIVLNGSTYSFQATANTAKNVVEGLQPLVNANEAVTCTEDNIKILCVSDVAGTSFTYSVSVTEFRSSSGLIFSTTYCSNVEYDVWQVTCVNGWQYRNVISSSPSGCTFTTEQQNSRKRECEQQKSITEPTIEQTQEEVKTISFSELYLGEAQIIFKAEIDEIISTLGIEERNQEAEKISKDTLVNKLKINLDELKISQQNALTSFITYGTAATEKLGSGERAGVVNSFQSAFRKIPETEGDWQDIVKIANGRWPNQRSSEAENNSNLTFEKVYLRSPDRNNPHDDAAVTIISYGLRPANRNLDSEKAAIKSFKDIYGYTPTSASAWDIVRAIAYSGAQRNNANINDNVSDSENIELNKTNQCQLSTPINNNLAYSFKGEEVTVLQDLLKCLGYFPKEQKLTNEFGAITKEAVIEFQNLYGITPTGLVGPVTREALENYQ